MAAVGRRRTLEAARAAGEVAHGRGGQRCRRLGKDGGAGERQRSLLLIRLKHIYNFLCSMLGYTPFALCFVTLHGIFMHFLELTY
jgi:hypothetical protein